MRENGTGTRKRSQVASSFPLLVLMAAARMGNPVSSDKSKMLSFTRLRGPRGPSGVMNRLWPARASRISLRAAPMPPRDDEPVTVWIL